jgi:nuclear pore complex protein Nup160
MCEENVVEKLVSFNFAGFNTEVEDALSFNARNADPRVRPFYSRILYTWYITRGDYRNGSSLPSFTFIICNTMIPAALVMYQRARKLALVAEPSDFVPMAELQMEAYLGAANALSLIDQKVAWIAIPLAAESDSAVCRLL